MAAILQTFQIDFLQWKLLYFYSNVTEWSNWWEVNIGSGIVFVAWGNDQ